MPTRKRSDPEDDPELEGSAPRVAPRHLSPEELLEIEEHFDQCDADGDELIDFREFSQLLENLEAGMGPEEQRIGFVEIDRDGDGNIDFLEFLDWWREP